MSREEMHGENQRLLIETANNVKWIRETMQRTEERADADKAAQHEINEKHSTEIDKVKGRVWMISGGLLTAQAIIAAVLEFNKR